MQEKLNALQRLQEIVEKLRAPGGCPWDRQQTLESISRHFLEETCEVIDAIEGAKEGSRTSAAEVCEEIGDLLMILFLAARIAEEDGGFDLAEVATGISEKLIRRHPHVFGDLEVTNAAEVLVHWKAIKAKEKEAENAPPAASILDGVPRSLPPLAAAFELGRKAAQLGFDWPTAPEAFAKVKEEIVEVEACEARPQGPAREELEHEIGDLLLAVANFSRKVDISPDKALREANIRFRRRFEHVERFINQTQKESNTTPTLEEMEARWQEAKQQE